MPIISTAVRAVIYGSGNRGAAAPPPASWDVSTAIHGAATFDTGSQQNSPSGLTFNDDGTIMYIIGFSPIGVHQYTLGTAYDVTTAVYATKFADVSVEETTPLDVKFKPDGLKMFVVGVDHRVYVYNLSPAWDVSTATYSTVSYLAVGSSSSAVYFRADGLKMFITDDGAGGGDVDQYDLSIAWDVTTSVWVDVATSRYELDAQETDPTGLDFKPDGTKMYVSGSDTDGAYQYTLGTPWDITTATYDTVTYDLGNEDGLPHDITLSPDGATMYMCGSLSNTVYQYTLGTAYDLSTIVAGISKFIAEESSLFAAAFSTDGTKVYALGNTNNTVFQYTLSSAWEVNTATYDTVFKVITSEDATPIGLDFNDDGSKMYMLGIDNNSVFEYDLGTPWNVSTAVYNSVFESMTAEDTVAYAITFSTDGTKMYMAGDTGNSIYQYTLGTPWALSSAVYSTLLKSIGTEDGTPFGVAFNPDGSQMFVFGLDNVSVYQYALGTPWNVSTAVYDSKLKVVSAQDSNPLGVHFAPDGTKMYIVGETTDTIYQYTLS